MHSDLTRGTFARKRDYDSGPGYVELQNVSKPSTVGQRPSSKGKMTMSSSNNPPATELLPSYKRGYVATLDLRLQRVESLLEEFTSRVRSGKYSTRSRKLETLEEEPPEYESSEQSSDISATQLQKYSTPSNSSSAPLRRRTSLASSQAQSSPSSVASTIFDDYDSPASTMTSLSVAPSVKPQQKTSFKMSDSAISSPPVSEPSPKPTVFEGIELPSSNSVPPLPEKLESKFFLSEVALGDWQHGPIDVQERASWGIIGDIMHLKGLRLEG